MGAFFKGKKRCKFKAGTTERKKTEQNTHHSTKPTKGKENTHAITNAGKWKNRHFRSDLPRALNNGVMPPGSTIQLPKPAY